MPTYEYECESCKNRFEIIRGFGENGGASCPLCSGTSRRVFSVVPIIFKGSGFYINDSRRKQHPAKSDVEDTDAG